MNSGLSVINPRGFSLGFGMTINSMTMSNLAKLGRIVILHRFFVKKIFENTLSILFSRTLLYKTYTFEKKFKFA